MSLPGQPDSVTSHRRALSVTPRVQLEAPELKCHQYRDGLGRAALHSGFRRVEPRACKYLWQAYVRWTPSPGPGPGAVTASSGHVITVTKSMSPQRRRSPDANLPVCATSTKPEKLSTGTNGQKEDAASPFVRAVSRLIAVELSELCIEYHTKVIPATPTLPYANLRSSSTKKLSTSAKGRKEGEPSSFFSCSFDRAVMIAQSYILRLEI